MADFNISDYYDDDEFVFKPRASKAVKPVQNVFGNKPNTNSTTTASTTVNPSNGAITKSVTTQTEQVSNPYEARVTPFGEIRQNTAFENLISGQENGNTEEKVKANRAAALGFNENGDYISENFETAHPNFDIAEYLRNIQDSASNEDVLSAVDRFFNAPMDESKRTVDSYKTGNFDDKLQKLVDDITLYNVYQKQLDEAYDKNEMPKVRADFVGSDNALFQHKDDYTGPTIHYPNEHNAKNLVRERLANEYDKSRKGVEREVYRKLAEVNRNDGKQFLLGK